MTQEIELKFILNTCQVDALKNILQSISASHHTIGSLISTYYETPNNLLHQHDIGLRVRRQDQNYEMTLKLSGQVTGGLHQRTEYNIPLTTGQPDLSLLPIEIWPADLQAAALQNRIQPLFTTDFQRETWQVIQGDSRIEVALDSGEIIAGDQREALCELELELSDGQITDLLALAQLLNKQPGLRQSGLSKAARGYYLVTQQTGQPVYQIKPLKILALPARSSIEQGLEGALKMGLAHWLYHEEVWLRGNSEAKAQVQKGVRFIRHTLMLFSGFMPRKASAPLRDWLSRCETLLTGEESAQDVAFSQQTSEARLALVCWLMSRGWRIFMDEQEQIKFSDSFKRFADIQLSRQAAELKTAFAHPLQNRYSDQLTRLARGLDAVSVLAGAYSTSRVYGWMENWLALAQAIGCANRADIDRYRRLAISQPPFWLHSGKKI